MAQSGLQQHKASFASGASDSQILACFHELDEDCNGELSVAELSKALQTSAEFARLTGASKDGKPVNKIAAGLIAQNLAAAADEMGNGDGLVTPDEFVLLCRAMQRKADGASNNGGGASSSSSSSIGGGANGGGGGGLSSRGRSVSEAPKMVRGKKERKSMLGSIAGAFSKGDGGESRAEAKLYALQACLQQDVVHELESLLLKASQASNDDRHRVWHEGVCAVLATARRIADSEEYQAAASAEGSEPPGQAEAEALELMQLRRDLSTSRIALAEAQTAKEQAEHVLKQERAEANKPKGRRK